MVSANQMLVCGRKNCKHHLNVKKIIELEDKLGPVKKKCFGKNKSKSLLAVDKCLSKSKDYLEMKKIMKKGRESIKNCIIKKCVKKTKVVRKRKTGTVKKGKSRKVKK